MPKQREDSNRQSIKITQNSNVIGKNLNIEDDDLAENSREHVKSLGTIKSQKSIISKTEIVFPQMIPDE